MTSVNVKKRKAKPRHCPSGKKRFSSEIDGKIALARIWRSNDDQNREHLPKRVYWHRFCGGYHLTHEEYAPKVTKVTKVTKVEVSS